MCRMQHMCGFLSSSLAVTHLFSPRFSCIISFVALACTCTHSYTPHTCSSSHINYPAEIRTTNNIRVCVYISRFWYCGEESITKKTPCISRSMWVAGKKGASPQKRHRFFPFVCSCSIVTILFRKLFHQQTSQTSIRFIFVFYSCCCCCCCFFCSRTKRIPRYGTPKKN